jgi:hypothetical protein
MDATKTNSNPQNQVNNATNTAQQQVGEQTQTKQTGEQTQTNSQPQTNSQQDNWRQLELNAKLAKKEAEELKKRLEQYESQKADEERKRLEAKGEYEKLLENLKKETEESKKNFENRLKKTNLQSALLKAGLRQEAIEDILDSALNKVEFDEELNPTVDALVTDWKTSRPFYFGETPQLTNLGAGIASNGDNSTIDETKLTDPVYVQKNLKAVSEYLKQKSY